MINEKMLKGSNQPCWDCIHAVPDGTHGCSWSINLEPVEGWVAEVSEGNQKSWNILHCPLFKDEKEIK